MSASPFDCGTCGACCDLSHAPVRYRFDEYVAVRDGDDVPEDVTRTNAESGKRFVIYNGNKCIAHRGTPGIQSTCTIYDRRPAVCREVFPGDPLCVWARSCVGITPLVPKGGFKAWVAGMLAGPIGYYGDFDTITPERRAELAAGALTTLAEDALLASPRGWGHVAVLWTKDLDPETHAAARAQRHERSAQVAARYGKPVTRGVWRRLTVKPKFKVLAGRVLSVAPPAEPLVVAEAA